jgi:hypothetical protein
MAVVRQEVISEVLRVVDSAVAVAAASAAAGEEVDFKPYQPAIPI